MVVACFTHTASMRRRGCVISNSGVLARKEAGGVVFWNKITCQFPIVEEVPFKYAVCRLEMEQP